MVAIQFILTASRPTCAIPDESPINVTANKKLTLFSQMHSSKSRNLRTILDWTSQIPLKVTFSSENNLREFKPRHHKLTVLY